MDFYIVLGVPRDASLNDVKRAFKRLARKYHPDINPGDRTAAAQFRRIAEAYETLSDAERRRRYDAVGSAPEAVASTFGFEGFDFSASVSGAAASTFGDLFAEVLQARAGRQSAGGPSRGADLHHTIAVAFDQALRGGRVSIAVSRQERCARCQGAGRLPASEADCAHCRGAGTVTSARGHMVFSKPCAHCSGTGRQRQRTCPVCGGAQTEMRSETLVVNVPAGLADQARIRIPAKGHVGVNGGEPGDLYVTVRVEPHPIFRRDRDDLHVVVPVAVHEAALGAKIDVPSPDGPARLRVPPGTQSGQRFRLRERGAPSPRDGRRGDLVVEVRIALPRLLDERSKALLREFGRINGEDVRQGLGG